MSVPKGTICTVITKLHIKIRLVSLRESLERYIKESVWSPTCQKQPTVSACVILWWSYCWHRCRNVMMSEFIPVKRIYFCRFQKPFTDFSPFCGFRESIPFFSAASQWPTGRPRLRKKVLTSSL